MLQLVWRGRRGAGSRRELCGLGQALNITKGCAFRWKAKEAGLQGMGRFLKIKPLNFERTLGLALSTGSSCQWREIWNCLPFGPKMEHWSSCDWFKWQVWFCKASLGGKDGGAFVAHLLTQISALVRFCKSRVCNFCQPPQTLLFYYSFTLLSVAFCLIIKTLKIWKIEKYKKLNSKHLHIYYP